VALVAGLAATTVVAGRPWRRAWIVAAVAAFGLAAVAVSQTSVVSSRVTLASQDRVEEAKAALRLAAGHPVAGVGPGRAVLRWIGPDGFHLTARYAHNEYLQTLAELGVVGLALLAGLLFSIGRDVWTARPPATASRELWAGVVAGLVALTVHSAFDFLWHIPAIPVVAAALVGIGVHRANETEHP
jgi:O-antigen ligase